MFMSTAKDESAAAIPLQTQLWPHFFTLIFTQYVNSFDNKNDQSKQL